MNDHKSALLWQMMQAMQGTQPHDAQENGEEYNPQALPWHIETLLTMRAMMPPKQQRQIDILVKIMELKELMTQVPHE